MYEKERYESLTEPDGIKTETTAMCRWIMESSFGQIHIQPRYDLEELSMFPSPLKWFIFVTLSVIIVGHLTLLAIAFYLGNG